MNNVKRIMLERKCFEKRDLNDICTIRIISYSYYSLINVSIIVLICRIILGKEEEEGQM